MPQKKPPKDDNLDHTHLKWLIDSRTANQRSALELHLVLETHGAKIKKDKELSTRAQELVAVCFSLWRAAFLADKTGLRAEVFQDAQVFLGKMLTDNAITYPQDRATREWTFNYYMTAAKDNLMSLSNHWPNIGAALSVKAKASSGTTNPSRRWNRHQGAFEVAIKAFQDELKA